MRIISGTARGTKLYTLEGIRTRPTLDRVKEPLFSIIQNKIHGAIVLDLFAGSGALGIETLSRGANNCTFCDSTKDAIKIVQMNLEKTKLKSKSKVLEMDYSKCLKKSKEENMKYDIVFIDPPYDSNLIYLAVKEIMELELLTKDGIIIAETDNEKQIINEIGKLNVNIFDKRKYGRAILLFLSLNG